MNDQSRSHKSRPHIEPADPESLLLYVQFLERTRGHSDPDGGRGGSDFGRRGLGILFEKWRLSVGLRFQRVAAEISIRLSKWFRLSGVRAVPEERRRASPPD